MKDYLVDGSFFDRFLKDLSQKVNLRCLLKLSNRYTSTPIALMYYGCDDASLSLENLKIF